MTLVHIETKTVFPKIEVARKKWGILGLSEANAASMGFAFVSVETRPDVTNTQEAVLAAEPTENADGSWSYKWTVRDKTTEEIEGQKAEWRAAMVVERWQFATACMLAGIITAQEAKDWGPGNLIPTNVEAALGAAITNPSQLAVAKVKALSVRTIRRTNPLIDILRLAFNLTEEQVDNLFIAAAALD